MMNESGYRNERNPKANIVVKNIPDSMDQKAMYELFSEYGTISQCKLEYSIKGKSLGLGYIQYETEEEALRAIEHMNET